MELRLLTLMLMACFATCACAAMAQPFNYVVELKVPEAYKKLLEENLEIYTWRDRPQMNADQLRLLVNKAPDNIRALLATEGFYSPSIASTINKAADKWVVRFDIDPGEPVRVAKFDVQVHGAFDDGSRENADRLQQMRDRWPLRPGMIFRQAEWEAAKRGALKDLLIDRYPAATLASSQAIVNPDTKEADLSVSLDSGPAFTFGTLRMKGLKRYQETIVEQLNPITPGSAYSQEKLLDFQAKLQNSGYFSSAVVSVETDASAPDYIPVQVDVVEKPSKTVGFGVGASTNTGARGQIEYHELNFLNRSWRLNGLLKLETKQQSLKGEIQFPPTALNYSDSVNAFSEHTDIEGVATTKYGIGAKRTRVRGKIETALALQFQTERQQVAGAEGDRLQALVLNYVWTHRDVDNLLYPTLGHLFSAQLGGGAKALLSDQNFARGYAKLLYFYPPWESGNLVLRGELGMVIADSRLGIPLDYLFRAGGDQSVRGYAYQSLGLKQADAVVGGRYLGVVSVEYVHWLSAKWGAAIFYDAGNAADELRDFKLAHGYGAGVRWKSPVGPLNFDVAYGQEVGKLRLHFSVGFAF